MVTNLVVLLVVATLVSGSLAVALPLSSPLNSPTSIAGLKMYDSAGIELPKQGSMYIVRTGETVFLQLVNISDNNVMMSGTTRNGETEVLIHYSYNGRDYEILYKLVSFQNGNSELVKWVVGDFSADMIYNPNDPNDTAITCNTAVTVMYGKVTSTGFLDHLRASSSAPDFVDDCSSTGTTPPTGTNDTASSNGNGGNGDGFDDNFVFDFGWSNDDGVFLCKDQWSKGDVTINRPDLVIIENCKFDHNLKIINSNVKIIDSEIREDISMEGSRVQIINTKVGHNIKLEKGSMAEITESQVLHDIKISASKVRIVESTIKHNIKLNHKPANIALIEHNSVGKDIKVKNSMAKMIQNIVTHDIKCENSTVLLISNEVGGKVKGCEFGESVPHDDHKDHDDEHHDHGDDDDEDD